MFNAEYQRRLEFADLPLVHLGGQNFLPPEVCDILPNQPYRGKLTEEHTASMITVAAKPPNVNAGAIVNHGLAELGFRQGAAPLGAFGVSIGTEMAVVPGRILPAPGIKYRQGTPAVDERASWNLRNVKFAIGATLDNWAVLVIKDGNPRDEFSGPGDPGLSFTMKGFADMCSQSGMTVGKKAPFLTAVDLPRKDRTDPIRARAIATIRTTLMNIKPKPTLVLIVLSNGDKHIYSGIKHLCDSHLDVGELFVFLPIINGPFISCQRRYVSTQARYERRKVNSLFLLLDEVFNFGRSIAIFRECCFEGQYEDGRRQVSFFWEAVFHGPNPPQPPS